MSDKGKSIKTDVTTPSKITTQLSSDPQPPFSRKDFFRDLKKVAKKRNRPSQSDR